MALDDTDYRLLAILRDNARTPVTSLAHALGVSRGTVQNRIDKLLENGIIRGFTIRLKPESEPHSRLKCLLGALVAVLCSPRRNKRHRESR